MGISVGEVEAVLAARDTMSPVFVQAAARVMDLQARLAELGDTTTTTFDIVDANLRVAKQRFEEIRDSAGQMGQSMGQVEGIAQRLIERMVILYAVRGAFTFTKDIFESADALQKMSDNLEIDTGKLQEWQYAADKTGTPMTQLLSAVDNLNKGMASGKDSTVSALDQLGLSFDDLWNMDPGKRFDTVAEAVAGVSDKLTRTGLEVELFGTDKIDGLVKKLSTLEDEANKAGIKLGPDTVRSLAQSDQAMKNTGTLFKVFGSEALDYAQRYAAAMDLVWLAAIGDKDAGAALRYGFTGSGNDPSYGPGGPTMAGPGNGPTDSTRIGIGTNAPKNVGKPGMSSFPSMSTAGGIDPNSKEGQAFLDAEARAEAAEARLAIASEQAADRYAKAWETAQKDVNVLWDKDIEAFAAAEKSKASITDARVKDDLNRQQTYNAARLASGKETDQQFYDTKASIERTYFNQHTDTLKANETYELNTLTNKEAQEIDKLNERYDQGKVDEDQFQQERAAITERYATERLSIEDKFNSDMDIRRRDELDKEVSDNAAAQAKIQANKQKQAADAAAQKKMLLDAGGTFTIATLSQSDLMKNYGNIDNAKTRLKYITDYFTAHPGGLTGTGDTGLASNDSVGWSNLLKMRQEYVQLQNAINSLPAQTSTTIAKVTSHNIESITATSMAATKALSDVTRANATALAANGVTGQTGVAGGTGQVAPGFSGGGISVVVQTGGVQFNNSIIKDRQSVQDTAKLMSDALVQSLYLRGWRPTLGVRS